MAGAWGCFPRPGDRVRFFYVRINPGVLQQMKHHAHVETKEQTGLSTPAPPREAAPDIAVHQSPVYRAAKRVFDLVVGIGVLVLLVPIIPIIALMIKLDSRGPVFYRQERVGWRGKPFKFYKFRSMVADADRRLKDLESLNELDGPAFKMRSDPRVTSVGRFLRRSSLDEIPQIFNVIRGEMSIVGPRPPLPEEVGRYQPWQRRRLDVKPGITCLWQISGRSHVGFDEWMRLDMQYLQTRGLRTDLVILLKTIPAVIARRGAY